MCTVHNCSGKQKQSWLCLCGPIVIIISKRMLIVVGDELHVFHSYKCDIYECSKCITFLPHLKHPLGADANLVTIQSRHFNVLLVAQESTVLAIILGGRREEEH